MLKDPIKEKEEREQIKQEVKKRLFEMIKKVLTFILFGMLITSLLMPVLKSIF